MRQDLVTNLTNKWIKKNGCFPFRSFVVDTNTVSSDNFNKFCWFFFFEKWTLHGKLPRTIQLNQTKDKTATSGQKTSGFEFGPKYERFCWRFSYLVPSMFYTSFEQKNKKTKNKKQKTKNKEKPSEIMKQSRASYKIVNRVQNRRFSPWSRYAADPQPVRWLR